MMNKNYGYIESDLNLVNKFKVIPSFKIPEEYSYENLLPEVDNQRSTHMCVPYSLSAYLNWYININDGELKNNNIDVRQIYKFRKYPGDKGMKFKSAFEFLKEKGIITEHGIIKIKDYLFIDNKLAVQQALLLNGPCMASIKLKTNDNVNEFWEGDLCIGGHAVAIVGYNKEGFIIRNSWGKSYGNNGYYVLPYGKFHNVIECWTIIMN